MATHLSHSIPWNLLNDICEKDKFENNLISISGDPEICYKKIMHFGQCLIKQLEEFRKTDNKSRKEEENIYDYTKWKKNYNPYCIHDLYSIILGYIDINMLLLDKNKWARTIILRNK